MLGFLPYGWSGTARRHVLPARGSARDKLPSTLPSPAHPLHPRSHTTLRAARMWAFRRYTQITRDQNFTHVPTRHRTGKSHANFSSAARPDSLSQLPKSLRQAVEALLEVRRRGKRSARPLLPTRQRKSEQVGVKEERKGKLRAWGMSKACLACPKRISAISIEPARP